MIRRCHSLKASFSWPTDNIFHDLRIHFAYHGPRHHGLRRHFFHDLKTNIHGLYGKLHHVYIYRFFCSNYSITSYSYADYRQSRRLNGCSLVYKTKAPTNSWLLALSFHYSSIIQATMKISSDSTRHCDFLSLQLGSSALQYDI